MVMALAQQRGTGLGSCVDTSLYTSGIWAAFPHMLADPPIASELLLSSKDFKVLAVSSSDAKVLGDDPLKVARSMDCCAICRKLDEHHISYVNESPTQSHTVNELLPEVKSVVLPASSEVRIGWLA